MAFKCLVITFYCSMNPLTDSLFWGVNNSCPVFKRAEIIHRYLASCDFNSHFKAAEKLLKICPPISIFIVTRIISTLNRLFFCFFIKSNTDVLLIFHVFIRPKTVKVEVYWMLFDGSTSCKLRWYIGEISFGPRFEEVKIIRVKEVSSQLGNIDYIQTYP